MNWNSLGTGTVLDLPMNWFMPRNSSMPARVTMNPGMPTYAIQKPSQAPMTMPTSMPSSMPAHHGMPKSRMAIATTMPTTAATDPTDRSMWPAMITRTMPIERIRM